MNFYSEEEGVCSLGGTVSPDCNRAKTQHLCRHSVDPCCQTNVYIKSTVVNKIL